MAVDLQIAAELDAVPVELHRLQEILGVIDVTLNERCAQAEVCVLICGEAQARELNAAYRGLDRPTNVLSFAADVEVPDCQILGDLVICWPVVEREAAQQEKNVVDHVLHLFVHGVLHLLGMDHERDADAQQMEAAEVRVPR